MKKILFLFLLISNTSCNLLQEKGIAFKITNKSDFGITNVKISTSENLDNVTFDSIAKNESQKGFLSMRNNKTDGHYRLSFIDKHGRIHATAAGYYSNGSNSDAYIRFEIQNDSTLVKFGEFPN